jgi:hypothetical protein
LLSLAVKVIDDKAIKQQFRNTLLHLNKASKDSSRKVREEIRSALVVLRLAAYLCIRICCGFQYVSDRHSHSHGPNSNAPSHKGLTTRFMIHTPRTT